MQNYDYDGSIIGQNRTKTANCVFEDSMFGKDFLILPLEITN